MTIVFLCGCLEPGKDGVGDYARRLAGALMRQGHRTALLGLHDAYVNEMLQEDQIDDVTIIPVLRTPAILTDESGWKHARVWIDNLKPDWISLQYVPFAFHTKGLDFRLPRKLHTLGKGYRWEVMFHELWVGMEEHAGLKMKLWGKVQKLLIRRLLKYLKPAVIHTQISLYSSQLHKMGFNANVLPLFSNIPVDNTYKFERTAGELVFLIFGSIYEAASIGELAEEAVDYGKKHQLHVQLILIGRSGREQDKWKDVWSKAGAIINVLGEQPAGIVSQMMQQATVGIATTPSYLIGKSGTVAAMLEHNLPVINITREWIPSGVKTELALPANVSNYRKGNLSKILSDIKSQRIDNSDQLKRIASIFNKSILNS